MICQTKALDETITKKYDIPVLQGILTRFVQIESAKNAPFFKYRKYGQKYFFRIKRIAFHYSKNKHLI